MTQAWSHMLFRDGTGWGLGDHLWQSTLGVAIAALLVWLAGPGRPALRHAIWLLASVKFLVPFAAIVAAGEALAPLLTPLPVRAFPGASFQIVAEPFTFWAEARTAAAPVEASVTLAHLLPLVAMGIWASGAIALLALRWTRWRRIRSIVSGSTTLSTGREVDAVRRVVARRRRSEARVTVREIAGAAAPALFGIHRAALLWPAGLSHLLHDREIDAVVTHELAHFRRHDNLAALVHTLVETVFWFHPLVWWMSARLVEERERACDQEALEAGVPPQTYAKTLLNVCRFGLARPQPLVASAAGSSIGQRVEAIMEYRPGRFVARPRGFAAALGLLMVCWPVAVGIGRAQERGVIEPRETDAATATMALTSPADAPGSGPQTQTSGAADTPAIPPRQSASPEQNRRVPWHPGVVRSRGIRALHSEQPTYTAAALRAGIEGSVELEALILPDGTVGDVRVVKSLDRVFGLDEQAVKTARLWLFSPPVDREDRPAHAVVTLILDFRLPTARAALVRAAGSRRFFVGSASGQTPASPGALPRDPKPAPPSQEDLEFRQGALAPGTPGLTPAKPTRRVQPQYTADAMRSKLQGSVEVEIVVGPDGAVDRARVVGGYLVGGRENIEALSEQARQAARQWRFEPATLDGKPVATWMRMTMEFKLY
jgi:TonB family protein